MSFLTTKEGMTFRCIRHRLLGFVASGTVILFLHVFSDYTGGDDISLHPARLFSSCMSFLTTQEGMTFCCLCEKNWSCWLRKELVVFAKRGDDILLHEYYAGNTFGIPSDVPHDVYCPPCRFNLTQEVNLRGETCKSL